MAEEKFSEWDENSDGVISGTETWRFWLIIVYKLPKLTAISLSDWTLSKAICNNQLCWPFRFQQQPARDSSLSASVQAAAHVNSDIVWDLEGPESFED